MAISFPSNPTIGDVVTAAGKTWTWNGAQWEGVPAAVNAGIPSGETSDRPTSPEVGDQFYNGTLGVLEIYTSSGWLPATGANDFNIVLTGPDTSVILDKEYFSGAYTITSALSDTSFDLYLFDTANVAAGYTKTPSINATSNFNKIVVLGGTNGDLLSFSYKTTFTTAAETSATGAGPIVKSISTSNLPSVDNTTVITGINFAEDIAVTFTGTNLVALPAKSIVRSSATSLIVTRPDALIQDHSPYTVTLTNPGVTPPTGTNGHIAVNAITAGGDPTWVTAAGALAAATAGQAYSVTLSATDPDGGAITYSVVTGQLPSGLTLNSSTGVIGGTASVGPNQTFTVQALDVGGNTTNRSFSIALIVGTGGTITDVGNFRVHTFTSSGTFVTQIPLAVELLVVAGGGAGGNGMGGGGGAGGLIRATSESLVSVSAGSHAVTVGAGAAGTTENARVAGSNSSAFARVGLGGGGGGSLRQQRETAINFAGPGGSGGGAGGLDSPGTGGAATQPSSSSGGFGNAGGNFPFSQQNYPGAGGGGAGGPGLPPASAAGDGGAGGPGLQVNIDGNNFFYAGGGGGNAYTANRGGNGGVGGGGGGSVESSGVAGGVGGGSARNSGENGFRESNSRGGDAGGNTGSGGGGATWQSGRGGSGGSGIVIVRYAI